MHAAPIRYGPLPVGYLTNPDGRRTHAIFPILESADDWESLPSVEADELDRQFLARFNRDPEAYLAPAPVTNPIRAARAKAKVTQAALADALGISPAALSKQEQEGHVPRAATLARALAKLAEISGPKTDN